MSESTSESAFDLQRSIEGLLDSISSVDFSTVREAVHKARIDNPAASPKEIAKIIIGQQALWSGLMGAGTGLLGLPLLVATLPVALVKTLQLQAFTIQGVAYAYGYSAETTDFKTDASLILSNKSFDDISRSLQKMLAAQIEQAFTDLESELEREEQNHQSSHNLKATVAQAATKIATATAVKSTISHSSRYVAQGAAHMGKDAILNFSTQLLPKFVQKAGAFPLVKDALLNISTQSMPRLLKTAVTSPLGKDIVFQHMPKLVQKVGTMHPLREMIWKTFGKQMAEKGINRGLRQALPVVGAVIGFGFDYKAIQNVGNVAIDYYENNGPEHLKALMEIFGTTPSEDLDEDNPFLSSDLDELFAIPW